MSDDALAALLWQGYTAADCWRDMQAGGGSILDPEKLAVWLRARGVVVLPPAVAEVLRTGEPSEAMIEAARTIKTEHGHARYGHDYMADRLRAALAVLR